ncbi:putative saccharopine dehydrogenase, NADP binding domain, NAD(P)-binding domain superfamily [Helianthus debilis subsp. tardiflorus]
MQKPLHLLNGSFLIKNSSIFKRTNHNVPSSNMKHDLSKPTYDVVIFGASGFTGKYVVREALKFLNSSPNRNNSPLKTLALAGRNHSKLSEALAWAAPSHTTTIPFLLADTNDPPSLRRMVSQAKLILNCAGPFRHHGGPVVDACVEAGCDYLDICGESEFMERMEALYHQRAVEKGSLVISACGIDSIPAELGFLFNLKQWVSPAVVSQVEAYISLESDVRVVANSATYESAVLGVAEADKLRELRRSRGKTARPLIVGPAPTKAAIIEHQKKIGVWAVKLPSVDTSIVGRTLATLAHNPTGLQGINETPPQLQNRLHFWSTIKPAHFGMKIASKNLSNIFGFITVGFFIGTLSKFSLGRWLLLKFPEVFSLGWFRKGGPTEEEIAASSFKMWFVGRGFSRRVDREDVKPDVEIITRLKGPEFGYVSTSIILIQCALIVLKRRKDLPKGGIYTPGIVFGPTDLQERLQENGISFETVSKSVVK